MKLIRLATIILLGAISVIALHMFELWSSPDPDDQAMPFMDKLQEVSLSEAICTRKNDAPSPVPTSIPSSTIHPNPKLDIELIGTSVKGEKSSLAIIAENGIQRMVKIYEPVTEGWTLVKVKRSHIVLSDSITEVIYPMKAFRGDYSYFEPASNRQNSSNKANDRARKMLRYFNGRLPQEVPFPMGMNTAGIESIQEHEYEIDLAAVQQEIKKLPIHRQAQYTIDDEGVELTEIVPGSLFDNGGFLPGDRVTQVNGEHVTDVNHIIMHALINPGEISVALERGDRDLYHIYRIRGYK